MPCNSRAAWQRREPISSALRMRTSSLRASASRLLASFLMRSLPGWEGLRAPAALKPHLAFTVTRICGRRLHNQRHQLPYKGRTTRLTRPWITSRGSRSGRGMDCHASARHTHRYKWRLARRTNPIVPPANKFRSDSPAPGSHREGRGPGGGWIATRPRGIPTDTNGAWHAEPTQSCLRRTSSTRSGLLHRGPGGPSPSDPAEPRRGRRRLACGEGLARTGRPRAIPGAPRPPLRTDIAPARRLGDTDIPARSSHPAARPYGIRPNPRVPGLLGRRGWRRLRRRSADPPDRFAAGAESGRPYPRRATWPLSTRYGYAAAKFL